MTGAIPAAATLLALVTLVLPTAPAIAHGGGLNAEGCHNDRRRGGYHCHRAPAVSVRRRIDLFAERVERSARSFARCADARAAGRAPIRIGEPGYARHLDRDGDGIACE